MSPAMFASETNEAADATRGHWGIENTHYTRDVTMGEDASRIRSNSGVFARLRSFAYNILKANRIGTLPRTATAPHSAGSGNSSNYSTSNSPGHLPCPPSQTPSGSGSMT